MLLRKLTSYSRKNRLYQAFRELGCVIRTIFLLQYISDANCAKSFNRRPTKWSNSTPSANGAFWLICGSAFHDAVHDAFMTLPSYTRSREGEVNELGFGVSNGSHTARSRPVSATRERIEREGPATSARSDSSLRIAWVKQLREFGADSLEEEKRSRQDHWRNSNNFIPKFTL
jgi:Tn3 transposase DDE domain